MPPEVDRSERPNASAQISGGAGLRLTVTRILLRTIGVQTLAEPISRQRRRSRIFAEPKLTRIPIVVSYRAWILRETDDINVFVGTVVKCGTCPELMSRSDVRFATQQE